MIAKKHALLTRDLPHVTLMISYDLSYFPIFPPALMSSGNLINQAHLMAVSRRGQRDNNK